MIQLGSMPFSQDILNKAEIGFWALEMDDGARPRLYLEEHFYTLLEIPAGLSPEETFECWSSQFAGTMNDTQLSLDKIKSDSPNEVFYEWTSQKNENFYIYLQGTKNPAYTKGIRKEGIMRALRITDYDYYMPFGIKNITGLNKIDGSQTELDVLKRFAEYAHFARWRAVFSNATTMVSLYCSDELRHLIGYNNAVDLPNDPSSFYKYIHPDDKQYVLDAAHKAYASEPGTLSFDLKYRLRHKNGTYTWVRSIGTFVSMSDNSDLKIFQGVIFDINAEQEVEKLYDRQKRSNEIIDILVSEYDAFFYVDFRTDTVIPSRMNDQIATTFSDLLGNRINYADIFSRFIDKFVAPKDQQMMREEGLRENIRAHLAHQKTYSIQYQNKKNYIYEMKCVKVGNLDDIPWIVIFSFSNKNQEVMNSLLKEMELKKQQVILNSLLIDYTSIYYVEGVTGKLYPIRLHPDVQKFINKPTFKETTISRAYELFIKNFVCDEDRDLMRKTLAPDYVFSRLQDDITYIQTYKNEHNLYCEAKCVLANRSKDCHDFIIAFGVRDKEIRKQLEEEEERKRNYNIIEVLASEYASVYFIDSERDSFEAYVVDENTERSYGKFLDKKMSYSAAAQLYINKFVFPEDQNLLRKESSLENISRRLSSSKSFSVIYRNELGQYCEMKAIKVGSSPDSPKAFAIGFANKDDLIRQEMLSEESKNKDFRMIQILASEYSSVYYVDITKDELTTYTMNQETEDTFGSVFRSGLSFSEAYRLYVDRFVFSQDQNFMLNVGLLSNVKAALMNTKTVLNRYRNEHGQYCEIKMVKVGSESAEPTAFALGFANKHEEITKELAIQAAQQKDFEIIEILASEYSSVYYVDINKDELTTYTMNQETEDTLGSVFRSGLTFSKAYRLYVDRFVFSNDQNFMLNIGLLKNVKSALKDNKTLVNRYRNELGQYCEIKMVKVGGEKDEPTAFALGFANKHEEITKELALKADQQKNFEIIEILASEYSSVYYVDINKDELTTYTMNQETENTFGTVFRSGLSFSEAYRLYVDRFVYSQDQNFMLNVGLLNNVKSALKDNKTLVNRYRNQLGQYCEIKMVKVGGEKDEPLAFALGFANKNEEIARELALKAEQEKNFEIIEILASEYTSVYYVDINKDELTTYTMNQETESTFGSVFRGGLSFSDAYNLYVNRFVYSDDQNYMLNVGQLQNVKSILKDTKTIVNRYRNQLGQYCEIKMVKVGGEKDEPLAFALGFANKHEEITKELALKKEHEKNFEIIEILASEYTSVYYVDINKDELTTYTMNRETESTFGSVFRSGLSFSEAYRLYVNRFVYSDDQNYMLSVGLLNNVKSALKDNKTIVNRYRNELGEYCEIKMVKVGGEKDEPTAFALGFANKHEEIIKELALKEEQDKNFKIIEILASEYSSVYYVNINKDELTTYTMNRETESTFGSVFRSGLSFSEAYRLYVNRFVLPDDRYSMLETGTLNNIKLKLNNVKSFITRYRNQSAQYCEMKMVKVGADNDEPTAFALGFANKNEEITKEFALKEERDKNFKIIEILASEYSSVYYVDIEYDELTTYTMNMETETTLGSVFRSGLSFSEAYRLYVDRFVLLADRNNMLSAGSLDSVKIALRDNKAVITRYRNQLGQYCEMKMVKVGADNDEPTAFALGFANKNEEITKEFALKEERDKNFKIIEILASEYSSVYYVDIEYDELTTYTMNMETETTLGSVFRSGLSFSEAYRLYVDRFVLLADRNNMLSAGSLDSVKNALRDNKAVITRYRNQLGQYCEMKMVKVGDDTDEPIAFALGFANKNEELSKKIMQEEEKRKNYAIIEGLASEYISVYYLNLHTDIVNAYCYSDRLKKLMGDDIQNGVPHSVLYRKYVENLVHPDHRAMMFEAGTIENIKIQLASSKTFVTIFRDINNQYMEMKFLKIGEENAEPVFVVFTFANKDKEISDKIKIEEDKKKNFTIIEGLASEYFSVYYINILSNSLTPYTLDVKVREGLLDQIKRGLTYSQIYTSFVENFVSPDDKAMMLEAGSLDNIKQALAFSKSFITIYKDSHDKYNEMKFVKVGSENSTPVSVVLAFADKDTEIRNKMARKEAHDRDNAVITGLATDFTCVLYTGYNDYKETHYRFDPVFKRYIPNWAQIKYFDERLRTLIKYLIHPDDREDFITATSPEVVQKALEMEKTYYVNFKISLSDRIVYYQAKFVRSEKSLDHVIVAFKNIDMETRKELLALEKAEAANKAKTTFLFNMSHDIRTPMNAIIGFTNMAIKNINTPKTAIDNMGKVKKAGNILLSLINDVLDMSRIESGKVKLTPVDGDLLDTFNEIKPIMQELAAAKNISLTYEISNIRDRFVLVDMVRVTRVLMNLISNAVKYTPEGGCVQVNLVQLPENKVDSGLYKFTVEDNGIGMSKEFQQHVFEEFAREETATVTGIQGTGLGLALCKAFTDLMHGTISCRSEKGKGSVFTLILPLKISTRMEQDININEGDFCNIDYSLNGKKVLLAEDNDLNREIAVDILKEAGLSVVEAENGIAAVDILKKNGPTFFDFILMDIQMPFKDGYEATKDIRNMFPNHHIPIIALSANAFEEDKQKSKAAGMDDHVAKPINVDILFSTMRRLSSLESNNL